MRVAGEDGVMLKSVSFTFYVSLTTLARYNKRRKNDKNMVACLDSYSGHSLTHGAHSSKQMSARLRARGRYRFAVTNTVCLAVESISAQNVNSNDYKLLSKFYETFFPEGELGDTLR